MAVTKKKTTKAPAKKEVKKDYEEAFNWLVGALHWRGKCADLVAEAKTKVKG